MFQNCLWLKVFCVKNKILLFCGLWLLGFATLQTWASFSLVSLVKWNQLFSNQEVLPHRPRSYEGPVNMGEKAVGHDIPKQMRRDGEPCSNTELKSWNDRLWWQGESLQTPLHPTTGAWKRSWASLFSGCIFKHLLSTKSLTEFSFLWLFSWHLTVNAEELTHYWPPVAELITDNISVAVQRWKRNVNITVT